MLIVKDFLRPSPTHRLHLLPLHASRLLLEIVTVSNVSVGVGLIMGTTLSTKSGLVQSHLTGTALNGHTIVGHSPRQYLV